jgi:helicase
MRVDTLDEHGVPSAVTDALAENGITDLNPPQEQAIDAGLLDGESLVVSSPTASGKTLIATLAIAKLLHDRADENRKAIYLVPLKALGSEKYGDYTEFFDATMPDVDVALSVGDRDSSDTWIENKDLILMTVEKLDAVLRHNPPWIKEVNLVVVDEIHLLNDEHRGPTLEVTLTRLRELMTFQLLGLSATIQNADAMANWLDCTLVESDYRPVDLKEGIYVDDAITFYDGDAPLPEQGSPADDSPFKTGTEKLLEENAKANLDDITETLPVHDAHGGPTQNILHDTIDRGHQAITFVRSRKSAESEAEKQGNIAKDHLSREAERELDELADQVKTVLGSPTKQCRRLARCVRDGTAFHHAGLLTKQRSLLEEAFRDGLLKSISATPTLAAGVSLPAYRIIIRDVKRYTDNGLDFIPTMEYKQMAGRAGRPEHHDEGQAIAVAKNAGDVDDIRDRYVLGEPENIYSKLAVEPVLRMHALGLIATRFVGSFAELVSFFDATFYAHQYDDAEEITNKLQDVTENLEEYGFITLEEDGTVRPTKLGKRVAELYIDPYTAHRLITTMKEARSRRSADRNVTDIAYLHMLCATVEMKPRLRIRKNEMVDVEDMLGTVETELLEDVPKPWDDIAYQTFLKSLKTAMMLKAWIEETDEDKIMDKFTVTPGGVRSKVERADWLLYACEEICTLKEWGTVKTDISRLRTRVKHGIKEDLISLVRFDEVGRVRARALSERDIASAADIREAPFNKLKNAVGKRTAETLKEQVGQDEVFDKENILDYFD